MHRPPRRERGSWSLPAVADFGLLCQEPVVEALHAVGERDRDIDAYLDRNHEDGPEAVRDFMRERRIQIVWCGSNPLLRCHQSRQISDVRREAADEIAQGPLAAVLAPLELLEGSTNARASSTALFKSIAPG